MASPISFCASDKRACVSDALACCARASSSRCALARPAPGAPVSAAAASCGPTVLRASSPTLPAWDATALKVPPRVGAVAVLTPAAGAATPRSAADCAAISGLLAAAPKPVVVGAVTPAVAPCSAAACAASSGLLTTASTPGVTPVAAPPPNRLELSAPPKAPAVAPAFHPIPVASPAAAPIAALATVVARAVAVVVPRALNNIGASWGANTPIAAPAAIFRTVLTVLPMLVS